MYPQTLFEQLFPNKDEPAIMCGKCLCQYCTHNVEELYNTVKLEEAPEEPCFNCDKCRIYTGDPAHRKQVRQDCDSFLLSDYGAKSKRKKLRII